MFNELSVVGVSADFMTCVPDNLKELPNVALYIFT